MPDTAFIKALFEKSFRKFFSEFFVFLFVFLCSFSVLVWADILFIDSLDIGKKLILGFCSSLLVGMASAFLCSLFKGRLLTTVKIIILTIVSVLFVTETFLLKSFDTLLTNFIASVILGSNRNEACELMSQTLGIKVVLFHGALLFSVFALSFSTNRFLIPRLLKFRLMQWMFGLALFASVSCAGYHIYVYHKTYHLGIRHYFQISSPTRAFFSFNDAWKSLRLISERARSFGNHSPKILKNDSNIPNVVFIMGESLTKKYLHCYGYPLHTTPCMDSLISRKEMVIFSDVIACAPSTALAVSRIFSLYSNDREGDWYDYALLPSVMKAAGYDTYWISNQEKSGIYVNEISALATSCDHVTYCSNRPSGDLAFVSYDEAVLPHLKKSSGDNKIFNIVHLMGSHIYYRLRYPEKWALFKPEDLPENTYSQEEASILSEYLNSVLYNDHIIGKIIDFYKDTDALILYVPDHGESIFEIPGKFGHGSILTPSTFQVPMCIWMSSLFRKNHPDKVERISNAADKKIMTDILSDALIDLLCIRIGGQSRPDYFIFSSSYDNARRRIPVSGMEFE